MGVRGLSAYVERNENAGQDVNLTEEAAGCPENEIALVLDLSTVAHALIQQAAGEESTRTSAAALLHAQLGAGAGDAAASLELNSLMDICGGECDLLDALVQRFFSRLRAAGVRPYCFLYPDKLKPKVDQPTCRGLTVSVGGAAAGSAPMASALRAPVSPLAIRQIVHTLHRLQVPVRAAICTGPRPSHTPLPPEASGREALLREARGLGAFAIVSDDSDFAVMSGSRWIPTQTLRVPTVEQLAAGGTSACARARLVTPERLASALGIPLPSLPDLAALIGNDVTGDAVASRDVLRAIGIASARGTPEVEDVAAWIRGLPGPSPASSPALRDLLGRHTDLREAWGRSAAFYRREAPPAASAAAAVDNRFAVLVEGVAEGTLPGHSIAVFRYGRHCGSAPDEHVQCTCGRSPPSDELVAPLRAAGYALLGRDEVEEHVAEAGCSKLTRRTVKSFLPPAAARHVPDTWAARSASPETRRRALAAILQARIPFAPDPEEPPEGPLGPAALLLRHLLSLVPPSAGGLDMSLGEWRAILLAVAACTRAAGDRDSRGGRGPLSSSPPALVPARRAALGAPPSFREVMVAHRFQAIVAACVDLAQVLWEPDFFPEPRALFSGLLFRRFLRAPGDAPAEAVEAAAELLALVAEAFPPAGADPALHPFLNLWDFAGDIPPEEEAPVPLHEGCWREDNWDKDRDVDTETTSTPAAATSSSGSPQPRARNRS
eukprot:tig00021314_g20115.t1